MGVNNSDYPVSIAKKMLGRNLTRRENYHLRVASDKVERAGGRLVSRQVIGVLLQVVSIFPQDEQDHFELERLQKEPEATND